MEKCHTIYSNFGCVPCGQKKTETVKIKNTSKRAQVLAVSNRLQDVEKATERLHIHPVEILAMPRQTVLFTLTYISYAENLTENYYYEIYNAKEVVAYLNIHANSIGPSIIPGIYNLKFFRTSGLDRTVRHVNITNAANCDAKFFFDLDEGYEQLEISQRSGVIPACHKLSLKFTFKPLEPGVFYKKIFCIVQFHSPLIFNIFAVCKPKSKLDVENITFRYPSEPEFRTPCETYVARLKAEKLLEREKIRLSQKISQEIETVLRGVTDEEGSIEEKKTSLLQVPDTLLEGENKPYEDILLTPNYLNVENAPTVGSATALVNLSKSQVYYYEWDSDPKNYFQVIPCRGVIKPNSKICFTINFKPSEMDHIYHTELDVKIFLCRNEAEAEADGPLIIDLPLTFSLRIIGNSFPDDSCGWVPQCKIMPKNLHLRPCVPGENVCGSFMIERQGHLPINFDVVPPKDPSFIVLPTMGYLSNSFQLLFVQFTSEEKEPGVYIEDLKIKFNNSDCIESIKLCALVEIPTLVLGSDNSITFPPVSPGFTYSKEITIENPTNLCLSYEFVTPKDITWAEVIKPKGSIDPKAFGSVEVIFKPEIPWEYLDYIPCFVSSTSEIDCTQTVYLELKGSCQFGNLIAMPSFHDFGHSILSETKTVKIRLFNFSPVTLFFQLKPALGDLPIGEPEKDVTIIPCGGKVSGKDSIEVEIQIKPRELGPFHYSINCQNYQISSKYSRREEPRRIFSFEFEAVIQVTQVVDVAIINGGPLFSPYWLWKMIDVVRINEALRALKGNQIIRLTFPEGMEDSEPVTVCLIFESGVFGDIIWDYKVEINCPCLEGSTRTFSEGMECLHTRAVFCPPTPPKLGPSMRLIVQITLKYDDPSDCEVDIIISSRKRKVTLRIPVSVIPSEKAPRASFFLERKFCMKPVFIGDPYPPVQLFWLYNNTQKNTSFFLDRAALWETTAPERKVFDCLNPFGVIPPLSCLPLAFVFRPKEAKEYTVDATVHLEENKIRILTLKAEGVLNFNKLKELGLEKTVPKVPIYPSEGVECYENYVHIPFLRVFSQATRLFFLKNMSGNQKWAFQWHSFHVDDVFNARVKPERGVIEPDQTVLMTLFVHTFSRATTVNASIPCDILNYSLLEERDQILQLQKINEKKAKEYFTITEKGETKESVEDLTAPEPKPVHIFLTVNVNIISSLNIDLKLTPKQQSTLRTEVEMYEDSVFLDNLRPKVLKFSHGFLEKLLWEVLCSSNVAKSIHHLQKTQDYVYLQLNTETLKSRDESLKRMRSIPKKINIQRYLETTIREVLCKNFVPKEYLISSSGKLPSI